jgi:serine/threonine protein phosphatase 1
MATVVIGDVHGNLRALDDLLAQLGPLLAAEDTAVFLGDYIDRGLDARGCIDRILRWQEESPATVVTLLGNHEDWLLRSINDHTRHSWLVGMEAHETIASYSPRVAQELRLALEEAGPRLLIERVELPYGLLVEAMPPSHLGFLRGLKLYHRTEDALCVHGGLDPAVSDVEDQPREALLWGTDGFLGGYSGDEMVVYGHWGNAVLDREGWPQPCRRNRTIGIDTISHGVLTAIRLPQMQVIQSARFGGDA